MAGYFGFSHLYDFFGGNENATNNTDNSTNSTQPTAPTQINLRSFVENVGGSIN